MKTRLVDTVTSNEEYVRLRIYDGAVPLDEAGAELIAIYQAQTESAFMQLRAANARIAKLLDARRHDPR